MNSKHQPSSESEATLSGKDSAADEGAETPVIKPFTFPFSPEVFAPAKRNDKPWHQHGKKSNHDQRPDAAPKGSRRSMGKR